MLALLDIQVLIVNEVSVLIVGTDWQVAWTDSQRANSMKRINVCF